MVPDGIGLPAGPLILGILSNPCKKKPGPRRWNNQLEAIEEAAEAVALSEAIQEQAARRAIAALITAQLIAEAAVEEAT